MRRDYQQQVFELQSQRIFLLFFLLLLAIGFFSVLSENRHLSKQVDSAWDLYHAYLIKWQDCKTEEPCISDELCGCGCSFETWAKTFRQEELVKVRFNITTNESQDIVDPVNTEFKSRWDSTTGGEIKK